MVREWEKVTMDPVRRSVADGEKVKVGKPCERLVLVTGGVCVRDEPRVCDFSLVHVRASVGEGVPDQEMSTKDALLVAVASFEGDAVLVWVGSAGGV